MEDLIDEINNDMKQSNSKESFRIRTSFGYLLFWSNSFSRCFIKQKENIIWIFTVTFYPREDNKSLSIYACVLAMGRSGQDHTTVIRHFMRDATKPRIGFDFYNGKTKKLNV